MNVFLEGKKNRRWNVDVFLDEADGSVWQFKRLFNSQILNFQLFTTFETVFLTSDILNLKQPIKPSIPERLFTVKTASKVFQKCVKLTCRLDKNWVSKNQVDDVCHATLSQSAATALRKEMEAFLLSPFVSPLSATTHRRSH